MEKIEIEIIEGHDNSSYFWIMPAKVIDISKNSDDSDNIVKLRELEISIEEENVRNFLYPILLKYFDDSLLENKKRVEQWYDVKSGFWWNLTENYYTFDSIIKMIDELKEICELLEENYYDSRLDFIRNNYDWVLYCDDRLNPKNFPNDKNERIKLASNYVCVIIDFYNRLTKFLEKMIEKGIEKGYNLISFMGP